MITRTVAVTMPPSTPVPMAFWAPAPGAGRQGQRQDAEAEGQRGHDDRAEAQFRPLQGGLDQPHPLLHAGLGELDDQDGVLGGQPQGGQKADLEIDVVGQSPQRSRR